MSNDKYRANVRAAMRSDLKDDQKTIVEMEKKYRSFGYDTSGLTKFQEELAMVCRDREKVYKQEELTPLCLPAEEN